MIGDIKTVFVDLDDTIWWFSRNSLVSLRHIYDVYGLDGYASYETFDRHYHDINSRLWELYHYGKISRSYLMEERFRYALEKIGCPTGKCAEMNEEYLDFLSWQPLAVPGAGEMLRYLSGKYDVNVLSNGFKGVQQRKLVSAGLDKYVNRIVLSDDCGVTKPLRGIFDYALGVCGAEAGSSVMIGDNYETDICGAKNAGWHAIFFNPAGNCGDYSSADAVVATLSDVAAVL